MARKRRTRTQEHAALLRAHRKDYWPIVIGLQGDKCGICGKQAPDEGERRFPMDHDHKTMEVRGVLCTGCNMRLTDRCTVEWMEKAIAYLRNPPATKLYKAPAQGPAL